MLFLIFIILFSFYAPRTMLHYDQSSHTPIQVAVIILYPLTVLFNFTVVGLFLITGYYAQGVRQARLFSISITKRALVSKVYFLFFTLTPNGVKNKK